jgi:hypothetical protein
MTQHYFGLEVEIPYIGFQCTECGKIVPTEDGKPPKKAIAEECPKKNS